MACGLYFKQIMNIHIRDLQIQLQQNELDDKNKTE